MWKRTTTEIATGETTEQLVNNRYFIDLLLSAVKDGKGVRSICEQARDGLNDKVIIKDEEQMSTFEYLSDWSERPTVIEGEEYHE